MEKELIAKTIVETLENALPEAVETVVDAKMKEVAGEFKRSNDDLKKQIEDIAIKAKFGSGDDSKEELHRKARSGLRGSESCIP
jgi:hypothetical protein